MNATADFLLEIGCEEIPAGMIAKASVEFRVILEKYLTANGLIAKKPVEVFGGPRRLAAVCRDMLLRQPNSEREVMGPPKSVAYDNVGAPTKAAESFASKQGIALEDSYLVSTARGEYLAAKIVTQGRPAPQILAEILPRAIAEIPWPRSMYWLRKDGTRFIRPIRWVVALLGGKVLPIEVGGIAAGRQSRGHRFLGKHSVAIRDAASYDSALRKSFVIAHPEMRRKKIEGELQKQATKIRLKIHSDPGLLDAVTYLNEYPSVILGQFDPAFLDLPEEILITVMRGHQKYFALEDRGGLAPHFLAVINLARDAKGLVRAGHERVLRARFADAQFFWQSDQKSRLAEYLPKLAHVTYESHLGSYLDKVERMRVTARWLSEQWFAAGITQASPASADRAAELSKCDLATEMVREFPELQGIVGGLYAESQGEPEEIATAIYDHYRPTGIDDEIPSNLVGCAVALADKLDALTGCIASGLMPTGSSDPFGLRRAALGVVKIILERELPLSVSSAISTAAQALLTGSTPIKVTPEMQAKTVDFILDRARFYMRERLSFAYDEVNAALAAGADDLVDAVRRVEAVKAIRKTKNFEPLAVSFKRIRKIVDKAGPATAWRTLSVNAELFEQPAERALYDAAKSTAKRAAAGKRAGKYREALQSIADLRPLVDKFFDDVMVMAENESVRRNRLTMLAELLAEFSTIADFSEIATTDSR